MAPGSAPPVQSSPQRQHLPGPVVRPRACLALATHADLDIISTLTLNVWVLAMPLMLEACVCTSPPRRALLVCKDGPSASRRHLRHNSGNEITADAPQSRFAGSRAAAACKCLAHRDRNLLTRNALATAARRYWLPCHRTHIGEFQRNNLQPAVRCPVPSGSPAGLLGGIIPCNLQCCKSSVDMYADHKQAHS